MSCQLLNVLSGELKADVAAATSSAVDSSHGNHLLGRDIRYDKGKSPKSKSYHSTRKIHSSNIFYLVGILMIFVIPIFCTKSRS